MKKLSHDEWQAVVKKEKDLLKEHLNRVTSPRQSSGKTTAMNALKKELEELEKLKKGGSTCLDCTLGRSLPH